MGIDYQALRHHAEKVYDGGWRFTNTPIADVSDAGQVTGIVGDRDYVMDGVGTASPQQLNPGDFSLTLTSGSPARNMPIDLGRSPYVC